MRNRRFTFGSILLSMALLLMGAVLADSHRLIVALEGTPPHLDVMSNTTGVVVTPAHHIFENLFNYDEGFRPQPMLVDTWESDPEGKVWDFTLRQGIPFHNGDEMTVDDVEASFNRWVQVSRQGKAFADMIFEKTGDYSFRMVSVIPRATLLENFSDSSQSFVIMPAEIVNAAGANEVTDSTQWIGTGPFQFAEFIPDESILLSRFDDYVALDAPRSGMGGGKEALVEELEFRIISDPATRVAALRAGEIDIVVSGISGSDRPTLEADPNIETAIIPGNQKWGPMFNGADSSWSSNRLFRQAVAAAMDHEELGLGIVGDPDLFDVNPGLSFRGTFFYSEAGSEAFNTRDQERARALLAEAGYDGEEIVFISTKARIFEDRMATVMQAQLQDVGINMRIDWYDLATLRQVRTVPEDWDIYPGGWGTTFNPSIYSQAYLCTSGAWSGFCEPALDELFIRAAQTVDLDERKAVYEELQDAWWTTYVPQVFIGDFQALRASRSNITGVPTFKNFRAWGVGKE